VDNAAQARAFYQICILDLGKSMKAYQYPIEQTSYER
jgi:hypothetical protein